MKRHANAEPVTDAAIEGRQRIVAWVGAGVAAGVAAIGVVGILLDRSLLVLWVLMIAFGVAKLPKAVYDRIRGHGR